MEQILHFLQWPAMAVSILGVWWVGDAARTRRRLGFSVLILSNVIWFIWAFTDGAWALLVMQIIFVVLNGRGFYDSLGKRDHEPSINE